MYHRALLFDGKEKICLGAFTAVHDLYQPCDNRFSTHGALSAPGLSLNRPIPADQTVPAIKVGTFHVALYACFIIDIIRQHEIDDTGRLNDVALKSNMFFILPRLFPLPVLLVTKRFFATERAGVQMGRVANTL